MATETPVEDRRRFYRVGFHADAWLIEDDHHLRRLLELNLGDPNFMERDIEALVADHTQLNLA